MVVVEVQLHKAEALMEEAEVGSLRSLVGIESLASAAYRSQVELKTQASAVAVGAEEVLACRSAVQTGPPDQVVAAQA